MEMELWTLINKETGNPIRFNKTFTDDDFGEEFYLTEHKNFPVWTTNDLDRLNFIIDKFNNKKDIHPQYSMLYESPNYNKVDLNNYIIKKILI